MIQRATGAPWIAGLLLIGLACTQGNGVDMARSPLTQEESRALADIAEFNRGPGRSGWELRDRLAENLDLAGIELNQATLDNVRFENVDLSGAVIRDSQFSRTDLAGSTLRGATIENTVFESCDLSGLVAEGTTFRFCTFRDCKAERLEAPEAVFEDCRFESFDGAHLRFKDADIRRTRFVGSKLLRSTFYGTGIDGLSFASSRVEGATFSGIRGQGLVFEGGSVVDSGFDGATYGSIRFHGSEVRSVTFDAFITSDLELAGCQAVETLGFIGSRIDGLSFTDCVRISELSLYQTDVEGLTITGGKLSFPELAEGRVTGESLFRSLKIESPSFQQMRIRGLRIEASKLDGEMILNDVDFTGLVLRDVEYMRKFDIDASQVAYRDSDRFPGTGADPTSVVE